MTLDILDVDAPFGLDGTMPPEVWIWSGTKCSFVVKPIPGEEWFIAAAHDEATIVYLHNEICPITEGSPMKIEVDRLVVEILNIPLPSLMGFVLMDRDGEVERRYVR